MYTAYGDESADEKKKYVFAIAGLFGNQSDWTTFREQWRTRTGGKTFHANACESDRFPYKESEHEQNKKLYTDLVHIIADSNLIGHALAISIEDYNAILAPHLDENPYYLCFQSVIVRLSRKSAICLPPDRIEFTFDRNHEVEHNAGALYGRMLHSRLRPDVKALMSDKISFVSREEIGIQAADLIAHEGMKWLYNRRGKISRIRRLATQVIQRSGRIKFEAYERSWFEKALRDSKDYHISKDECGKWLQERGLHNTLGNRILYEFYLERTDENSKK